MPATTPQAASRPEVIHTPDQRVRVFVSCTLRELAPERDAARDAVDRLRLVPVMFELGARPHPPRDIYRAYLSQSQIFIGIYWQSYGWVSPYADISGIEDEYQLSAGMPRLIYVKMPRTRSRTDNSSRRTSRWTFSSPRRTMSLKRSPSCARSP